METDGDWADRNLDKSLPGDTMACEAKSDLYELEEKTLRCQLRLSVLLSLRLSP